MNSKLIGAAPFFTLRLFSVGLNVVEEIVNIPYIRSTWLSLLFATNGIGVASEDISSSEWKVEIVKPQSCEEKNEMNTGKKCVSDMWEKYLFWLFFVFQLFFW